MASPGLFGSDFSFGFRSDDSREQIGQAFWRIKDWLPHNGAPLRKRGGYGWASGDLSALSACTYVSGVGWAAFAGDEHLVAISEGGKVYRMAAFTATDGSFVGASGLGVQTHRPFWYKDRLIILQGYNAAAASPQKYYYSGGVYNVAALGGTPPTAKAGMTWLDYAVLANVGYGGNTYPYRIIYSGVGNSESWTPGTSFFDLDEEIIVGTVLRGYQIFFGYKQAWLLQGDTPPPNGNLKKVYLFKQGCMDPRSLVNYREYVVWANAEGVWKSDGSTLTDLTLQSEIANYYRSLVKNFKLSAGWIAAAGQEHGSYFLSLTDNTGAHITTLRYDLERETWDEHTNIQASMYAERLASGGSASAGGFSELFFGHRSLQRAGALAQIWLPDSTNAADADGTNVLPSFETAYYRLKGSGKGPAMQHQRVRRCYVSYDLRALSGGSPNLQVDVIFSPESTSYLSLTPQLPDTTQIERFPVDVREKVHGVGFRVTQQFPSSDTRLYGIELEGHALEGSQ